MVTLSILGILLMLGVPAMDGLIRSNRLTSEANQFVSALHMARAEAARLRGPVTVQPTALPGAAGAAEWGSRGGYAIVAEPRPFQDLNRDGLFIGPGELEPPMPQVLRNLPALNEATRIISPDATNLAVTFLPNGMLLTRALQLQLCDDLSPDCRQVTVSPAGRITVTVVPRAAGGPTP
jgi:type II secretory pathway pseudopilin PulG